MADAHHIAKVLAVALDAAAELDRALSRPQSSSARVGGPSESTNDRTGIALPAIQIWWITCDASGRACGTNGNQRSSAQAELPRLSCASSSSTSSPSSLTSLSSAFLILRCLRSSSSLEWGKCTNCSPRTRRRTGRASATQGKSTALLATCKSGKEVLRERL